MLLLPVSYNIVHTIVRVEVKNRLHASVL